MAYPAFVPVTFRTFLHNKYNLMQNMVFSSCLYFEHVLLGI